MTKISLFLFAILIAISCHRPKTLSMAYGVVPVTITETFVGKYSYITGTFNLNGSNYRGRSNDGYYYKKYSVKVGDVYEMPVRVHCYTDNLGDTIYQVTLLPKQYENPK